MKRLLTHAFLLLLLTNFTSVAQADRIVVFAALEEDIQALEEGGNSVVKSENLAGRVSKRFTIGSHEVLAILTGAGCVESGVTAASVLSRYCCDFAISVGPAGYIGEDKKEMVGSWWRINSCVSADIASGAGSSGEPLKLAEVPQGWNLSGVIKDAKSSGIVAGEKFVNTSGERSKLAQQSRMPFVDMNTHGLQVACSRFGVPLAAWRVISDNADESASIDFKSFVKSYDGSGGKALVEVIKTMPANPDSAMSHPGIRKLMEKAD